MKRSVAVALALGIPTLGILLTSTVGAYVLLDPERTWDDPPTYLVDERGIASIDDSDHGVSAVVDAITSTDAWNGAGAGTVVDAEAGSVSGFSLGDGTPMLDFEDPTGECTGNCLAATFTAYYSDRGDGTTRIDDADIVTNASGHAWTSETEDPGGSGCSNEIYVEAVMVHEVGHGLGLDHTSVSGATMFPSIASCDDGPATLAQDDADGIDALYGDGPPPCGGFLASCSTGAECCGGVCLLAVCL